MIEKKTTLVLGAGASAPYGFPLGAQLRRDILNLGIGNVAEKLEKSGLGNYTNFAEFLSTFRYSRLHSIDAFLTARPEMAEVGKAAIATILFTYESEQAKRLISDEQDWYDYLWNRVAAGHTWNELSFENLSIVTFNYDRSLEHFLLTAMSGTFNKTTEETADKLSQLKIVHVYGDIGTALLTQPGYEPYARDVRPDRVSRGASRIKVIPEARDDEPTLIEAQRLLRQAEAICFLGFGFDRTNLRRLRANETCSTSVLKPKGGLTTRPVIASCMNMTRAEVEFAARTCGIATHEGNLRNFIDGDCISALRQTLILG